MEIKIIKNSKKDFTRKDKKLGINVLYPKFEAKTKFKNVDFEFSEDDYSSRSSITFKDKITPKNRLEYGEDFVTSDGKLLILRHKLDNKGRMIITEIEIFGKGSLSDINSSTRTRSKK